MRSQESRRLLGLLLWTVADSEKKVEQQRISLCEHRDFVSYSAFKAVDRLGLGRIEALDLIRFLRDSGITYSDMEVKALIRQYDGNDDLRLNEAEFEQLVLPASDVTLRTIVTDRVRPAALNADSAQTFRSLLDSELRFHQRVEEVKTELLAQSDFSLIEAFRCIDSGNMGFLDRAALKWFLRRHEYDVNDSDLDAIFRRWDTDDDERLAYREFCEALAPLSPPDHVSLPSPSSNPRKSDSLSSKTPNESIEISRKSDSKVEFRPSEISARASEEPRLSSISSSLPSGLTEAEKQALLDTLHEQIVNFRELELLKQEASLCPDFNVEDAFGLLDAQDRGEVSSSDLAKVLMTYGIKVFGSDAELLIRRYAGNEEKMTLDAFTVMVSPQGESYRRLLHSHPSQRRRGTEKQLSFRATTRTKFIDLLRLLLHIEHRNEVRRQGYGKLKEFHPEALFTLLTQGQDLLTAAQLRRFLSEYGVYASDRETDVLVSQYAGRSAVEVTQEDFLREVSPHSSQEYL